jgi:hypothetical protein
MMQTHENYARLHLRFGWWSLFVFTTLGLVLEAFHGFKAGLYLDVSNDTRRLMWTLAHAHGTLLAIINIVFGLSVYVAPPTEREKRLISASLIGATVVLPAGFFLGGTVFYNGDPGLGILLVPLGAIMMLLAIMVVARSFPGSGSRKAPARSPRDAPH